MGRFADKRAKLEDMLFARIDDLGIDRSQIVILTEFEIGFSNPKAPLVAVFFGYKGVVDGAHQVLAILLKDSITIIPCVEVASDVATNLPKSIGHINAFPLGQEDSDYGRLATLILENLRLLRAERRLFISYKRSESQSVAVQLYENFDKAGFDVFLDTRSVPYGVDFQSILWHRMADSDIVVLLDTPNFRASHWTQQELSQANATSIQILHLLWPKVRPDQSSAFSEFALLQSSDFKGRKRIGEQARLVNVAVQTIVAKAESLRARALAARHRSLVDNFCDRARDENAKTVAVQPERFISVTLANGGKVAVVPTIGIPRADRYQEIDVAIRKAAPDAKQIWLLYDERGILDNWLGHLEWLDSHLPVKSVQVSKCADRLRGGVT
jgi:uncharacterized protein YjiS (DUF1127 family)